MAGQWALLGNLVIAVSYAAIAVAISVPLVRARQATTNRLAAATALIFVSCAVGHGLHAVAYFRAGLDGHHAPGSLWPSAVWDVLTAAVGVYYWTLRRGYGVLLGKGALYVDPHELTRRHDIELREQVAAGRAEAEAERDAHAAMLRAVIANSQSLVYVKDLDGRYLLANEAFQRSFGLAEEKLLGETDDVIDPVLAPMWREHDLRARSGAIEIEDYADTPDGRHVFESVKFPLYDPTGRLYATCGMSLDVTRLRRAMADAEHARDEALAQSQVKSDFLATMSHEIRTPMNGVLGLSSLLLGTDLDATQRRYAAGVHTAGNALLGVINDILDFSKIEAGRLELDPDDFAISTVLDEVTALMAPAAADKGLSLRTMRGVALPARVRGDSGRLRQILLNLVGNAIKFTADGSVTVGADVVAGTDPPTVRFEVIDTGIGIAADTAERLFEPFTQADASTTRTYGGTGLGLAISRRLAEAMGGTLGVDSRPGHGSTFWCALPFTAALGGDTVDAPDVSGLRILVVQDGDGPASLGADLRAWRMSPTCTHSGAAALHALRDSADRGRPYDVLIIDADAGVDPLALVGAVEADSRVPRVHVVVLGAAGPAGTTPGGDLLCLPRPVHRSQLFDVLAHSLRDTTPRTDAPRTDAPPTASPGPASPTAAAGPAGSVVVVDAVSTGEARGDLPTSPLRASPLPVSPAPVSPAPVSPAPVSPVGRVPQGGHGSDGRQPTSGDPQVQQSDGLQLDGRPADGSGVEVGAPAAVPPDGAANRILLVEDNEINQLVAVGILMRLGYGCDVASDGVQALELIARHPYDVILMDCRMPRMDGFTATAELRRREGSTRHTPVVAMTASALAADRDRCLAAGMDDYLAKPVTLDELGAVLRRWMADTPGQPQTSLASSPAASTPVGAEPVGTEPVAASTPVEVGPVEVGAVEVGAVEDPLLHRLSSLAGERTAEELGLVAELITSFLDRVPRYLAALGEAVANADAEQIEDRAHSLAGAAGNIGAQDIADVCRRLEERGRDHDLADTHDELRSLRTEVEVVDRRLRSILTGGAAPVDPPPDVADEAADLVDEAAQLTTRGAAEVVAERV